MKTFPMFLQMAGRQVVIAGGGEQAAQKTRLILKTEAKITLLAPELDAELSDLLQSGRVQHDAGPISPKSFEDTALTFIATGCPGADMALHALAKAGGATVNVVDQPTLCDAITPSIVDRDPVVVAIGTEGTAPVLARQIKTRIEETLEPRLGELAALAGRLRATAAMRLSPRKRRDLWRWVFNETPRRLFASGAERQATKMIKDAIQTGTSDAGDNGALCFVHSGPGAKDLMTLRGVQRLQEADVIYYDHFVNPDILELARRDAERVFFGNFPGCQNWPLDKTTQILASEVRRGDKVVRLIGQAANGENETTDELELLRTMGIATEVVPGVMQSVNNEEISSEHKNSANVA